MRRIHAEHFEHVPLSSVYRYARNAPARFQERTYQPGVRVGNGRATSPHVDDAIAYLYTRGMTGPALARVLGVTRRVVGHRITQDNLLAMRHEYQRRAVERCANDFRAGGIDPDLALARLDAEHEAEVNGRMKEDS